MDDLIQERVTQKENELNAEYDERMRNYEERYGRFILHLAGLTRPCREKDLQRQVQTAKGQMRDLHSSNESTQAKLLNANERQGTSESELRAYEQERLRRIDRARRSGQIGRGGLGGCRFVEGERAGGDRRATQCERFSQWQPRNGLICRSL